MTDQQAKVTDIVATRKMIRSEDPVGTAYVGWCHITRGTVYSFEGRSPNSRTRMWLAIALADLTHFLGRYGCFWIWQILTRLKWNVADGDIPFYTVWKLRSAARRVSIFTPL
jgi:hypothetical protein